MTATPATVWQASLFVAALGASSYTWAEVTRDQQMESWLLAHMHALEHWGGVPLLVVPDNTKTGVTKACRYDPDVNPTYQNFAAHYGFGVLPARPYKPRDKAIVENAVQVAQRWILAALRHRKFFSLAEANQAIRELLHRINHRPFRKRDGSRASVFEALDKPALQPLPQERFEISEWARARVNIDYHVAFDGNFYSVPYNLVQEAVEIRSTVTTVEILHHGVRVASHVRSRGREKVVTNHEHRPKSHQAHLEWPPSRMVQWAENDRPPHRAVVREDPGRQTAPGDGISRLPGDHSAGRQVLACAHGGGGGAGAADRRVPLPQHRIDPEELARPAAPAGAAGRAAGTACTARQHSRRGVLRVSQ